MSVLLKHFAKQNKKLYIYTIIMVLVAIIVSVILIPNIKNSSDLYDLLETNNSVGIGITNGSDKPDTYRNYGMNISLYLEYEVKECKNPIKCIVLQEYENCKYDENSYFNKGNVVKGTYAPLLLNEFAISEMVAKKYNLDVGDEAYFPTFKGVTVFKLKYIYKEVYNIYDIDFTREIGSLILSNENGILTTSETFNICFIDPNDTSSFNDIYLKSDETEKIALNLFKWKLGYFIILSISCILITFLITLNILPKLKRLLLYGQKSSKVIISGAFPVILFVIIPVFLILIASSVYYDSPFPIITGCGLSVLNFVMYFVLVTLKLKGGIYEYIDH